MRITVLGAGAWGTALAKILQENGNAVTLWDKDGDLLQQVQRGKNEKYLPGVALPSDWKTGGFKGNHRWRECVVLAVPSQAFREVSEKLKGHREFFVSVTRELNLKRATR